MDRPDFLAIDGIRDTLVEVRDRARREGQGLLAHLINEAAEEVERIRATELPQPKKKIRKRARGIKD